MSRHFLYITGLRRLLCVPFALVLALSILLTFGATQTLANKGKSGGYTETPAGGYTGPGPTIVTVEQISGLSDDSKVALKGYIIRHIGGKDYEFKDASGTVILEISEKRWQGQSVAPEDLVEIRGEVDKDWSAVKIEVKQIIKQ